VVAITEKVLRIVTAQRVETAYEEQDLPVRPPGTA